MSLCYNLNMIKAKRKTLLISLGVGLFVIAITIVGLGVYNENRTYPIGDNTQVVYLGKKTTGSNFIFSDQRELTSYYYGTDMTPEELARYFDSTVTNRTGVGGFSEYSLTHQNGDNSSIWFYEDKTNNYASPLSSARNTSKKYFFSILSQDYEALKAASSR